MSKIFRKAVEVLLIYFPAVFVLASLIVVVALNWLPVGCTPLMVKRAAQSIGTGDFPCAAWGCLGACVEWTPLEDMSDNMIYCVIAAEDQKFYSHNGFDAGEFRHMMKSHFEEDTPLRGCSTISQQTAKNCFTWCTDTYFRKIVEAYYTVLIERIWGKDRILEVYLNIAEFGPGIYGADEAARSYFSVPASRLNRADASSLVCCLPNPLHRTPDWVCSHMPRHRARVASDAAALAPRIPVASYETLSPDIVFRVLGKFASTYTGSQYR